MPIRVNQRKCLLPTHLRRLAPIGVILKPGIQDDGLSAAERPIAAVPNGHFRIRKATMSQRDCGAFVCDGPASPGPTTDRSFLNPCMPSHHCKLMIPPLAG